MNSELHPSKLGTKEYWDKVYESEITNFEEIGDEGEVCRIHRFGIESVKNMVKWVTDNVPISTNPSVLEIGAGNGALLFGLCEAGYPATSLSGIDYSPGAVKLAKAIASSRGYEIAFHACEFLHEDPPGLSHTKREVLALWDVMLDKGTFDAIALSEKDEKGNSPATDYPGRIGRLLKSGGHFLITSCNFTEDELKKLFATTETGLVYHSRVTRPVFTFGGIKGSAYSSVAFQKTPC
ncbi:S-adenosyl-L-methionine-dependent methyltransferase [Collybia nuda]|uniref:Protein-lysine N-methyltransferase EFM4 n=1 Tax=Collybia nuda TaxID=64659 RepID=A0A9P5XTT8_9AGAR|nr:S-adenosyl-L-methionine-dependent methyltransferase [Collybia nuda]